MTEGIAQPAIPGVLEMKLKDVKVLGTGLAPSAVLNVGEAFTFETELEITGILAGLLAGDVLSVSYYIENVESGVRTPLQGNPITIPGTPGSAHFTFRDGPYTAGVNPLPLPAGAGPACATYRILTHLHAVNPSIAPIVAAFHDGLVVMVMRP